MLKIIAVLALGIAGAIHVYISPSHFAHASAHGIFFAEPMLPMLNHMTDDGHHDEVMDDAHRDDAHSHN
ncbi:MAG: hypothetical protein AAF639_31980 [Chloroflexota bacterium]